MEGNNGNKKRDEPDTENRFNFTHEIKQLSPEDQLVVFLPGVRWKRILDRLVAPLIAMSNLSKLSGQKRVNDRSEKNDSRNEVERLPLNPVREFFENRRNLLVMVAIDRRRKVSSRYLCARGRK